MASDPQEGLSHGGSDDFVSPATSIDIVKEAMLQAFADPTFRRLLLQGVSPVAPPVSALEPSVSAPSASLADVVTATTATPVSAGPSSSTVSASRKLLYVCMMLLWQCACLARTS